MPLKGARHRDSLIGDERSLGSLRAMAYRALRGIEACGIDHLGAQHLVAAWH
jgi:hypothetical protein